MSPSVSLACVPVQTLPLGPRFTTVRVHSSLCSRFAIKSPEFQGKNTIKDTGAGHQVKAHATSVLLPIHGCYYQFHNCAKTQESEQASAGSTQSHAADRHIQKVKPPTHRREEDGETGSALAEHDAHRVEQASEGHVACLGCLSGSGSGCACGITPTLIDARDVGRVDAAAAAGNTQGRRQTYGLEGAPSRRG